MAIILPTTLGAAAAAAVINFWLANRIGRLRMSEKVSVGDGGHDLLGRRMRAQLNFAENVPFMLILLGLLELARPGWWWLSIVAALYMLGRVLHGLGMDGGSIHWARVGGIAISMVTQLGLAVVAVLVLLKVL